MSFRPTLPFVAAAVWIAGAAAATVPRLSFREIVEQSPRIVHGEIVGRRTAWDDARSAIWTHYRVRVAETIRGETQAIVEVSEPGGALDGLRMTVPGAPGYRLGEEVIIFLTPTPIGFWRTCGWGQGKFEVVESAAGEAPSGKKVRPAAAIREAADAATEISGAAAAEEGLEAFKARIREELRRLDAAP